MLLQNQTYTNPKIITPKGLMIHSVGVPQPKADAFMSYYNNPDIEVSVHGFIEPTGVIYQCLPYNYRAWHCGGAANATHIAFEMTEPKHIVYTNGANYIDNDPKDTENHVINCYAYAVKLFADLCKQFTLDPTADGVVISHHEGHMRGIASNHADPEHLWGRLGITLDEFRKDIANTISTTAPQTGIVQEFNSYKVRVNTDWLNIRSGAGTNFPVVSHIDGGGVYTIVDQVGTWGKLKSGVGWISLNYTIKL